MDDETLTALLAGGHLNMEERFAKKLWPHSPIPYKQVQAHLTSILHRVEWFPCDLSKGREGIVVQSAGNHFICHALHYSAFGYPIVSETNHYEFNSAEEAADFYLKHDLHLPGDLDGWVVV